MRPTQEEYQALEKAFAQHGRPEFKPVGKLAKQPAAIAKRAWEEGFPSVDPLDFPMPAIKDTFHAEVIGARAARAAATRKLIARHARIIQDATDDQTHQRAVEGMTVRSLMLTVDAMAREMLQFTTAMPKIQAKINSIIQEALDDPEIPLARLQQIVTWGLTNLDLLMKSADKAQVLERRFMGEPDQTIKITDSRTSEEKVSALAQTLMMLSRSGRLNLVPSVDGVIEGFKVEVAKGELTRELVVHAEEPTKEPKG